MVPTRSCSCDLHLPPLAQIKRHCVDKPATTCTTIRGPQSSDYPFNYLLHDRLATPCPISVVVLVRPAHACSAHRHACIKLRRMPAWVARTQGTDWASHAYSSVITLLSHIFSLFAGFHNARVYRLCSKIDIVTACWFWRSTYMCAWDSGKLRSACVISGRKILHTEISLLICLLQWYVNVLFSRICKRFVHHCS